MPRHRIPSFKKRGFQIHVDDVAGSLCACPCVVAPMAGAFVSILKMTMINRSLGENAAIALGRLAMKCPEQLSAGFGELVAPWCG